MQKEQLLSFWQALLININVMFGSGIFINTLTLFRFVGILGFLCYGLVAVLLLPLIASMIGLLRHYPNGGFYTYAATELHPLLGCLSAWSYFIGKLASATLLIHVFTLFIQTILPFTQILSPYLLDCVIIGLFTCLNFFDLNIGSTVNYVFVLLKILPILFCIMAGIALYHEWSFEYPPYLWQNIPNTLPLVMYAFFGFEAACSLSMKIKDASHNAAKALLYSFWFTVTITMLYQLIIYVTLYLVHNQLTTYLDIFPTVLSMLSLSAPILLKFLYIASACAALGGAFGMLLSNQWNLFVLARNNTFPYSALFTQTNKFHMPFVCSLTQGLICFIYLIITKADQITLQQICVFGVIIAFFLSAIAYLRLEVKKERLPLISSMGLISCGILLATCIRNFYLISDYSLFLFCLMLMGGFLLFIFQWLTNFKRQQSQ